MQMLESLKKELETFLKGYGADTLSEFVIYRRPDYFVIASGASALIACFLGISFRWQLGMIGLMAGFFLPGAILYASNLHDNAVILKDLKWLYETISVQLEAGLHIRQAILESEGMMKNKRLRKALKNLSEELINGEDMTTSLESFEKSFRNHYVNSFCLILRQMQDSGYAVKLLGDIRLQLEEMELQQLSKKKQSLEMELQVFQLLLFAGILVLVMYGCILAVLQNVNLF